MGRRTMVCAAVIVVLFGVGGTTEARGRPADPPLPTLECGTLPDHDVRLTADLTCTVPFTTTWQPGDVRVPWVPYYWEQRPTIDLGGHTLDITEIAVTCHPSAPRAVIFCGIVGPYRYVNGTVRGSVGNAASFDQVNVHGNVFLGYTAGAAPTGDASMRRSAVVDGFVRVGSKATIERSRFVRARVDTLNNESGVVLDVHDNVFADSPGPAAVHVVVSVLVRTDISATVEHNLIVGSEGAGVRVDGQEWALGPVDVERNLVLRSGGDGIVVRIPAFGFPPGTEPPPLEGGPVVLSGNLAVANAGHGIVVDLGDPTRSFIVDGGGNRAFANALDPPCIGIVCR